MRKALTSALIDLAAQDERVVLLTADLGFMVLEPFIERFPDRFFNVGVAEQNMIGVATGLAEAGFVPFVYSIVTFASLRPYEFIRNGPVLHQLPVRIAAIGGGYEYGDAGPTHHGLEDAGVMRIQPGLTVVAPADHQQARAAVLATWDLPGPVYYRLGKDDQAVVPGLDGRFELGRIQTVTKGDDVLLVAMGSIAGEAVRAAERLGKHGIMATVAVVSSLNPAPTADLADLLSQFPNVNRSPRVFTVEAHYVNGGVGSLVAEVIAENRIDCQLVRLGVRSSPDGISGGQAFLYRKHGIDRDGIAEAVVRAFTPAPREA
ncbi:MAG: transketolase C-terminal domain-containing protein [Anaerolineae bacterium]